MMRSERQPWEAFDLVQRAAVYAADAHRHDLRKGTSVPYLAHLWSVAALVLEHGGDDVQVAVALLHDVAEDHGGRRRLDDVRAHFGDEVAALVEALSDSLVDTDAGQAKPPWEDRKRGHLANLATTDPRALLVAACDKLHNTRSILAEHREHGSAAWTRFNERDPARQLWYYQALAATLSASPIPEALVAELRRTVGELSDQVRTYVPDLDAQIAAVVTGVDGAQEDSP